MILVRPITRFSHSFDEFFRLRTGFSGWMLGEKWFKIKEESSVGA
jgi:hypothetical protein